MFCAEAPRLRPCKLSDSPLMPVLGGGAGLPPRFSAGTCAGVPLSPRPPAPLPPASAAARLIAPTLSGVAPLP